MVQDPTFGLSDEVRSAALGAVSGFSFQSPVAWGAAPVQAERAQDDAQGRILEAIGKVEELLGQLPPGTAQYAMLQGQRGELTSLMRDAVAGRAVDATRLERVLANVQSAVAVAETTGALQTSARFAFESGYFSAEACAQAFEEVQQSFAAYQEERAAFSSMLESRGYSVLSEGERQERGRLQSEVDALRDELARATTEEERSRIRLRMIDAQQGILDVDQAENDRARDAAEQNGDDATLSAIDAADQRIAAERDRLDAQRYRDEMAQEIARGASPEDADRIVTERIEADRERRERAREQEDRGLVGAEKIESRHLQYVLLENRADLLVVSDVTEAERVDLLSQNAIIASVAGNDIPTIGGGGAVTPNDAPSITNLASATEQAESAVGTAERMVVAEADVSEVSGPAPAPNLAALSQGRTAGSSAV